MRVILESNFVATIQTSIKQFIRDWFLHTSIPEAGAKDSIDAIESALKPKNIEVDE